MHQYASFDASAGQQGHIFASELFVSENVMPSRHFVLSLQL